MTKKILIITLTLIAGFSTVPAQFQQSIGNSRKTEHASARVSKNEDVNLNGKWTLTVATEEQQIEVVLNLSQSDKAFEGSLSSTLGNGKVLKGSVKDNEFSAVVQANIQGQDLEIQMSGKVDGEKMSGAFVLPNSESVAFEGVKSESNTDNAKTAAIDLNGAWMLKADAAGQQIQVSLDLKQSEKTFSGTLNSSFGDGKVLNGTIKDTEFSAVIQANIQGQEMAIQMKGKLSAGKMTGTFVLPNSDFVAFEGTKAK